MIDFYALTSPNVQKIYLALEELELPYRENFVDVWKGDQFQADFLKVNPNAKIPAIVDHEGPGGKPYAVFESGAILLYLADKTGKLLPKEPRARFDAIQWLMIQMTGVGPTLGQLTHYKRFAPAGNEYGLSRHQTEALRLADVLDGRLGVAPFLGGSDYSIADVATWPWMRNHDFFGIKWAEHPNLARWFEAIASRPATKRALAKIDLIKSSRDQAKPEDLDRIFGRGRFARAS